MGSPDTDFWFSELDPPDGRGLVSPTRSTIIGGAESTDDNLLSDWLVEPQAAPTVEQHVRDMLLIVGYRVLSRLALHDNSRVYVARRLATDERVAAKVLLERQGEPSSELRRFRQEARLLESMLHPNLVKGLGHGSVSRVHYAILELSDGVNLRNKVEHEGPLPFSLAARCAYQTADALEYMHQRGVIHRDVKPANLVLTEDGRIKLLDLGLARAPARPDASITLLFNDRLLGTPDFMAPEQALDCHQIDPRVDLYSLGCMLYYLLAGQPPLGGKSVVELLIKHQSAAPTPIEHWRPDVPPAMATIVRKLMAKRPEDRYQTAGEAAGDLSRWCAEFG